MKKALFISFFSTLVIMLAYSVLSAEEDPFAGMDPGSDSGLDTPDGASSIRAKKKPSAKAFQGKIKAVAKSKGKFPEVTALKIEITKLPSDKAGCNGKLEKKKTYFFAVRYKKDKDKKLDYKDESTKTNVGAWYFEKNDKVIGEIAEKKGNVFVLDYIQRK